jgi:hypothetical protein
MIGFPAGKIYFFFLVRSVQTGCVAHPDFFLMGIDGSFAGDKAAGA